MKRRINLSSRIKSMIATIFFVVSMMLAFFDCIQPAFKLGLNMTWARVFYLTTFTVYFYSWAKSSVDEQKRRNKDLNEIRKKRFHDLFNEEYKQFKEEMHGK